MAAMTDDHFHQLMGLIRGINSRLDALEADFEQLRAIQASATAPAPALAADGPLGDDEPCEEPTQDDALSN
jgi:hypothetical protein